MLFNGLSVNLYLKYFHEMLPWENHKNTSKKEERIEEQKEDIMKRKHKNAKKLREKKFTQK